MTAREQEKDYVKFIIVGLLCLIIGYGLGIATSTFQVMGYLNSMEIEHLEIDLNESQLMDYAYDKLIEGGYIT